jgi:hypothetical protein
MATKESDLQQGASYPYVSLQIAMTIAEAVRDCGGAKSPVPKSLLASRLKEDEKSQGLTFRIGAAKCFGLIEGRSAYTLTPNAQRYFYPTTDQDKVEAQLSFLAAPSAFSEIIKRYDGSELPKPELLANIFHRQLRVPESWSTRTASYFTRAAQLVGALDEKGFLRFGAAKHESVQVGVVGVSPPGPFTAEAAILTPPQAAGPVLPPKPGYHPYILPLSDSREVTILAPLDITEKEIKRLQKWIEFTLQIDWSEKDES